MSSEANIRASLQITKGKLSYQSNPTAFTADVAGTNGPTPGSVVVSTAGTNISLAQLTAMGGFCRLMNLDSTNYVTYGVYDGVTFFPLGEILPGESYVLRLSRILLYGATGTASVNSLRFKANVANCVILCEAFEP